MLRFCIVEDEEKTCELLKCFIERSCQEYGENVMVVKYFSAEKFLQEYSGEVDVVFMDINLPGINGMKAAKALCERDKKVLLIFVTNLAQYAINGYEVGAFDFVVKPISYGSFVLKMNRVFGCLSMCRKRTIVVSTRHGKQVLDTETLKYVEITGHSISYHMDEEVVVASGTLKDMAKQLEGLPFAMCNRCYLVNLSYVTKISGVDVTVGGETLLISRPRRKDFLKAFNDFLALGGSTK